MAKEVRRQGLERIGERGWSADVTEVVADLDSMSAASDRRPLVSIFVRGLNRSIDAAAVGLLVCNVLVLFTGVLSRYVFHRPLIWTDELASILFIWLVMLGSVIALRRGTHMRLTVLVSKVPHRARVYLEALATAAVLLFLLLVFWQSWSYALDQWDVETPALGLHDTVRVVAIPVGALLMIATASLQFARFGWMPAAGALGSLALVAIALMIAAPGLKVLGNADLVIFFVVLLGLAILLSAPIGCAFGLATFCYLFFTTHTPLSVVVSRMDEGMSNLILLAVPLFVFLGALIEMSGMAASMINFLAALVGHLRGGLSYVLLAAMYLISGISGSKAADMAAVAPVLFPEMKRRGADEGHLVSLLAASGAMSETIPPSLVLITIGSVVGISISALFTGGMLPALVLALALGGLAWHRSRGQSEGLVRRPSVGTIFRAGMIALPGLVLPIVIRLSVTEGIATATEVSTIGIAYTFVVGVLIYRGFELKRLYAALVDAVALSGSILLIIGTATSMAWALTQSGFSHQLAATMASVPGGRMGFLAITILVFMVLGSLLEGIPAIVLFGPLLFPVARQFGINDVHYAMVVILAMGIGLFAPPVGIGYYYTCAIANVSPDAAVRKIWPYLAAVFVGLVIVALVPWISIGLL
jgi:tripartite ATP-independent transporter DctM subunit